MPDRIAAVINAEDESSVQATGIISRLNQLLQADSDVEAVYLCQDSAIQVCKLPNEGNHFCGYRNMQMLCLALGQSGLCPALLKRPTIPELQAMIEHAWDQGFNPHGRVHTGGIVGTRKHVGTPEAEALLLSLNVPCTGNAFNGKDAWRELLDATEEYFTSSFIKQPISGVHTTSRMPVFLQRPHHSLTVVGIEVSKSGQRSLLVFDPAHRPPGSISRPLPRSGLVQRWTAGRALGIYRRSESHLKRFSAFETLVVEPTQLVRTENG